MLFKNLKCQFYIVLNVFDFKSLKHPTQFVLFKFSKNSFISRYRVNLALKPPNIINN